LIVPTLLRGNAYRSYIINLVIPPGMGGIQCQGRLPGSQ